jgi:hypothetical protein
MDLLHPAPWRPLPHTHAAGMLRLTQHQANRSNPRMVMVGLCDYIFIGLLCQAAHYGFQGR